MSRSLRLTAPEREVLYRDVATRVANRVPQDLIRQEFDISAAQLRVVFASELFRNTLAAIQAGKEDAAQHSAILTQEDWEKEAKESFDTIREIRDANRPSAGEVDYKAHKVAMQAGAFILEAGGHGKIQKSVTLEAKVQVGEKDAEALFKILEETKVPSSLFTVDPKEVRSGKYDELIQPGLANDVAGATKDEIQMKEGPDETWIPRERQLDDEGEGSPPGGDPPPSAA
jgi:hypothetical protein